MCSITSTAHALLTAQAGYRVVVLGEGGLHASPFHGYSTFVKVYRCETLRAWVCCVCMRVTCGSRGLASCVSVGYFLSDAVVIVRHFRTLATPAQNAMFIVHHLFGAVGYMICVVRIPPATPCAAAATAHSERTRSPRRRTCTLACSG